MKAFEFTAKLRAPDTLAIPSQVAVHIPSNQPVRVLLLVPDESTDAQWEQLTAEQFLKGYDQSDSVYDELPTG